MKRLDLSTNIRLPILSEILTGLSLITDPQGMIDHFTEGMRRAYGARTTVMLSTRGLPAGQFRIMGIMENEQTDSAQAMNFWDSRHLQTHNGGLISQLITDGPNIAQYIDLSNDPVLGDRLASYHSAVAAPVYDARTALDWLIILDHNPDAFSPQELEEVVLRTNLLSAAVVNLHLAGELERARARIDREMQQIARIQRTLLPDRPPEVAGVNIAAHYETFDVAGGDLYDFLPLADGRIAMLVADVSGHGPAAAVVMAIFHAILHAYPYEPRGPGECLRHVNRHLCAKQVENSFVTAFLAFYDPKTRKLTYARAGHNPPLVKQFPHEGDPVQLKGVGGIPLGIDADVTYEDADIILKPMQTLILYTDGITEAAREGGEMFGVEGIERSLVHCSGKPDCAISHITEALKSHQKDWRPQDDQTLVVMQVLE